MVSKAYEQKVALQCSEISNRPYEHLSDQIMQSLKYRYWAFFHDNRNIALLYFIKKQYVVPYSLYLAHHTLSFFKIALKILGNIASQLAHSENESCFL